MKKLALNLNISEHFLILKIRLLYDTMEKNNNAIASKRCAKVSSNRMALK